MTEKEALAFLRENSGKFLGPHNDPGKTYDTYLEALDVLRAGVEELERWRLGHKAAIFVSKEPK